MAALGVTAPEVAAAFKRALTATPEPGGVYMLLDTSPQSPRIRLCSIAVLPNNARVGAVVVPHRVAH